MGIMRFPLAWCRVAVVASHMRRGTQRNAWSFIRLSARFIRRVHARRLRCPERDAWSNRTIRLREIDNDMIAMVFG